MSVAAVSLGHLCTGLVGQLPPLSLVLQITISSVNLYLTLEVVCYCAVWNETLVDFDAFKIVFFFK
jgi:hypothetical protein